MRALIAFAGEAEEPADDDELVRLWRRLNDVTHEVAVATVEVASPRGPAAAVVGGGAVQALTQVQLTQRPLSMLSRGQPPPRPLAAPGTTLSRLYNGSSSSGPRGSTNAEPSPRGGTEALRGAAQFETYCDGSGKASPSPSAVAAAGEAGSLVPAGKLAVARTLKASVQAIDLDKLLRPGAARARARAGIGGGGSVDAIVGRFGRDGSSEVVVAGGWGAGDDRAMSIFVPSPTPDARGRAEALMGVHVEVLEAAHGMLRCLPDGALGLLAALPKGWFLGVS